MRQSYEKKVIKSFDRIEKIKFEKSPKPLVHLYEQKPNQSQLAAEIQKRKLRASTKWYDKFNNLQEHRKTNFLNIRIEKFTKEQEASDIKLQNLLKEQNKNMKDLNNQHKH